jgi:saccharopine dehydrogenase-like NADP-dependent oxidoreductase
MYHVIVLGGGRVGGAIAKDLASDPDVKVTVADEDPKILTRLSAEASIGTIRSDLSDPQKVKSLAKEHDLVVGAVPGFLGFRAMRAVLEAGKSYCDISFFPEDALQMDHLAKEKGVTALVDCGVAPGLSNMIVGRLHAELDATREVSILVGGLPKARIWPYEYKAPFSPIDVIEEYTRPARYVKDGHVVTMPALSESELVDIPGVGVLEAFNTDGLRSLLKTIKCPNMREKTLRYPGHAEKMKMLRETGFFDKTLMEIDGAKVRTIDLTSRLLFPMWKLEEGEEEFTVMRIEVVGMKDGKMLKHIYDLLDTTDKKTGISSMARTTGFPCAIMTRLLLSGEYERKGVIPPEIVGQDKSVFEKVMAQLHDRGVIFRHDTQAASARATCL